MRLFEDRLARGCRDALRAGAEQIVILGAGFDSRAYRIPGMERVRVFEVDHPDTQADKRARPGAAGGHGGCPVPRALPAALERPGSGPSEFARAALARVRAGP